MRRTLVLAALVAVGLVLVATIKAPRRPTSRELVRGPRPFHVTATAIRRIEIVVAGQHLVAERGDAGGWRLGGVVASDRVRDALDALAHEVAELRAVDAFRPSSLAALGLDPPAGWIAITTVRGTERLDLGVVNPAGSSVYARRDGHARVLQLGVYLLEVVRRLAGAAEAAAGTSRAYWPEIG
jgi:hypothetical protein